MGTTISVSRELVKELKMLKIDEGYKSIEELIRSAIVEYKKKKYLQASKRFRERMERKGLRIKDLQ